MRFGKTLAALSLMTLMGWATGAAAQSSASRGYLFRPPPATLTVYGGLAMAGAGSDVFSQTFDDLTLGRRDFQSVDRGVDLAITMSPRVDLVFSIASNGVRRRSSFRDWVDNAGAEIEQTTRFTRTPVGIGARYYLRERGRMIGSRAWVPNLLVPFVGGAVGGMKYRFVQYGDFIDPGTLNVFGDEFAAEGVAPFAQGSVGLGWSLYPAIQITGEMRYVYARGDLGRDFSGFDRIDLSGVSSTLGLTIRF